MKYFQIYHSLSLTNSILFKRPYSVINKINYLLYFTQNNYICND
jgi:hypothetical protein